MHADAAPYLSDLAHVAHGYITFWLVQLTYGNMNAVIIKLRQCPEPANGTGLIFRV